MLSRCQGLRLEGFRHGIPCVSLVLVSVRVSLSVPDVVSSFRATVAHA